MLKQYCKEKMNLIDKTLNDLLPKEQGYNETIFEAMRYSLFAGGKRLRPILLMAAAEAIGSKGTNYLHIACGMEMIHTYSLIHDDLPAMDNDDYRRGKLTNHKVYGEATAILAGDALLTMAFRILAGIANNKGIDARLVLQIIDEIADAAGVNGMIGGQVVDIESENKSIDSDTLVYIHTHKTGALYCASLRCGAILAGASDKQISALTRYAEYLGLAFQITDDILDVEGDSEKLGKETGSDEKKQKATYPAMFGLDRSKSMAREAVDKAIEQLCIFNEEADLLRDIAEYLLERDH
jgi:geranylgeranyl diphosphate synthase type II